VPVSDELLGAVAAAMALVKAHRMHGHLAAHLDPLGSEPPGDPALEPERLIPKLTPELQARVPAAVLRMYVTGDTLADALPRLRSACGREFLWERASADPALLLLARGDCRSLARRLSCDQEIAADGFFSLGMIADFEASLQEHGEAFYRHLFWESGFVGQILYLEAEAAGARSTGIGCFFDDPVHDVLGLGGHAFQSLYHFTVGVPVEDARLTTELPYLPPLETA